MKTHVSSETHKAVRSGMWITSNTVQWPFGVLTSKNLYVVGANNVQRAVCVQVSNAEAVVLASIEVTRPRVSLARAEEVKAALIALGLRRALVCSGPGGTRALRAAPRITVRADLLCAQAAESVK